MPNTTKKGDSILNQLQDIDTKKIKELTTTADPLFNQLHNINTQNIKELSTKVFTTDLAEQLTPILGEQWLESGAKSSHISTVGNNKSILHDFSHYIDKMHHASDSSLTKLVKNLGGRYTGLLTALSEDVEIQQKLPEIHAIITEHVKSEQAKNVLNKSYIPYIKDVPNLQAAFSEKSNARSETPTPPSTQHSVSNRNRSNSI